MTAAINIAVRQGSPEWVEARRSLITATAIPILLGLNPYRCEADLADEMNGGDGQDSTLRMRIGSAIQPLIGEEYTRVTGRRLRTYRGLLRHPVIEWAAASPDFGVVGERRLVEAKKTSSRLRFADGIPQDVEAQVAWQLGVTGYPAADVVVLVADDEIRIFEQLAQPDLFDHLVTIAADFRRRLAAGGPFSRDNARLRRDYPSDNGLELVADQELTNSVYELVRVRGERKGLEDTEGRLEAAIKGRMTDFAVLRGPGFAVTWKRTKDRSQTDWQSLATGLLHQVPETERDALVGLHTTVSQGFRPMRVVLDKEE